MKTTQIGIQSRDLISVQQLIDAIPVAVYVVGQQEIIDCNTAAVSLFDGMCREDLIGKPPGLLFPRIQKNGRDSVSEHQKMIGLFHSQDQVSFFFDIQTLTGRIVSVKMTVSRILFEDRECHLYSCIDMAGLVRIEENETLITKNPYALIEINPDLTIAEVNPAFLKMSGYMRDEWIGRKFTEFSIISRNGATITDAMRTRSVAEGELVIDFPTGARNLEYSHIPVVDPAGDLIKWYAIFADRTELVKKIRDFDTLVQENPASMVSLDIQGNILAANPAFEEITHLSKEKLLSMGMRDFRNLERKGMSVTEAVASKKPGKGRMVVDFGWAIRTLDYTYLPVLDVNSDVSGIMAMYIDVTDQVSRLEEMEAFIRDNPHAIMTISPEFSVMDVNPAFCKISGYTHEQATGMNHNEFRSTNREGASAGDAIRNKKAMGGKIICLFPGGIRHLEYTYLPIFDKGGNVTKVFDIFADVTPLVNKINESDSLVSNNPASIITTGLTGNILAVNQAYIDLCQIPLEQLLSMNIKDFEILDRTGATIGECIASKNPGKGSITIKLKRGATIFDCTYIPIIDINGTVTKVTAMYIDMTSIRTLLKYLEKSVGTVLDNLNSLAKGDTRFTITILEADEHSASARAEFVKIGEAINTARLAIAQLVSDSNAVAKAAIAGDMRFRSDPTVHEGDFRAVIEGINHTLDSISVPINESLEICSEYACYNFTSRFDEKIEAKGDWIQFKEALNNIGLQVSDAIQMMNKSISDLAASAEEANASIEEVLAGTQQITQNTGKVSQNANQCDEGTLQVLKAMEDLNATVGEVSRKAESVSVSSGEVNSFAKEGISLAKKSDNAMNEITSSTHKVGAIVNDINTQMDEIGKIVRLISDIASQTNLLALNAAIEAARAGEAGRGFAVVAAEVKSLAQDSRKSAENIADMISALQNKTNQANEAMGLSTAAVQDGSAALEETLKAFTRIAGSIEDINRNIVEVASASEEEAASVEEVTANIQEVATLIQNTSQEAGNTAAATEEANASMDEIGRIMSGVVGIVETVTKEMSKFKVA